MFGVGLFMSVFSLYLLIGGLSDIRSFVFINSPEKNILIIIILAFVFIAGVIMMICGGGKRSNKAALDSIVNSKKQNYCDHCKINVAGERSTCPVCGRQLKNRGG